jgi:hypothetical protein
MGSGTPVERRSLRTRGRFVGDNLCDYPVFCLTSRPDRPSVRRRRSGLERAAIGLISAVIFLFTLPTAVRADKLSFDERLEIERGLTAEFATAKVPLPRSKKGLVFHSDGTYDKNAWDAALREGGPAARVGDEIQITRVQIESNKIRLEINGGTKSGHWYDHVQVGMGGTTSPVSRNQNGQPVNGSHIVVQFPDSVPSIKAAEIRQMLAPVFDFEKHSATEQYVEKLPEPIKKAIKEQHAVQGMDRDQVLLALGKPHSKSRQTSPEGDEIEDWVYGEPPGKVTFVTFSEGKVSKVQESYANIGGTTAPPLPPAR